MAKDLLEQTKQGKRRKRIAKVPKFASEDERFDWWAEHGKDVDADAFPLVPLRFEIQPTEQKCMLSVRVERSLKLFIERQAKASNTTASSLTRQILHAWQEQMPEEEREPTLA